MALDSPGVRTTEEQVGGSVQELEGPPGAAVVDATWGPAMKRELVSSESQLREKFGEPTNNNATRWFTAANFLGYVGSAYIVRVVNENAKNAADDEAEATLVKNDDEFENASLDNVQFLARYPGKKGNSIRVHVADSESAFEDWEYAGEFDSAPATSQYAEDRAGDGETDRKDELHIVVVDEKGKITGTKGTILETYGFLSKASDAKTPQGGNNYFVDVINADSEYIYAGTKKLVEKESDQIEYGAEAGEEEGVYAHSDSSLSIDLSGGTDGDSISSSELVEGIKLFRSKEDVQIRVLLTADGGESFGEVESTTLADEATSIAEDRKDCIVVISPMVLSESGGPASDPSEQVKDFTDSLTRSTFAVIDSGWKYQYDTYNDKRRWIPLNGDVGGLISRVERDQQPWFSPAGFSRGNIQRFIKLAWNPDKNQRNELYRNGVNPVVSFPGGGTVLFGDKTFVSRPDAFDRINVRMLFITVRTNIARFSESILFEQNDSITREQFTAAVNQYLESVQARRGIERFEVIADTSVNTSTVRDNNEFRGNIFIRPVNSINFINLRFVAVRGGIDFEEVVG